MSDSVEMADFGDRVSTVETVLENLRGDIAKLTIEITRLSSLTRELERLNDHEVRLRELEKSISKAAAYASVGSVVGGAVITALLRMMSN